MTQTLWAAAAASGNPTPSSILATSSEAAPSLASPLVDWPEVFRFLDLLGRSPDSTDAILFPPKEGPGSDKRAHKLKLNAEGRQSVERLLSMPLYRHHALGIRPNPGGAKASEITEGRALFFEADGGLPLEAQEALPELLGLPEPTMSVWSGGKSLHLYWCAKEGGSLSPQAWRKAQERLIAAVEGVAPEAGVDGAIKDPSRVMRAPGGLHPATGERCRIHSASGTRYSLAALVELLPPLPEAPARESPSSSAAKGDAQGETRALEALGFLPPLEFTSYGDWLKVGMALHSVGEGLLSSWIDWSQGMGEAFDEEECQRKWQSFSSERDGSLSLGSLIHWAKAYGYRGADTPRRYTAAPSLPSAPSLPNGRASADSGNPPPRPRLLPVPERMALLRAQAAELLEDDSIPLLDRLPVLREAASKLDLHTRDGDLQRIVWEAKRKAAAPTEEIATGQLLDFTPTPWCWEGLLIREATNLVVAAPKVGKTSLILEAIAAWSKGESFLGRPFHGACPPVLIVGSDQPESDWGRMLQKVGLVSEERRLLDPIVGLYTSGRPLSLDPQGIEKIAAKAKEHPGLLVVIDSYARCISSLGLSERDAEIAGPLSDLQEALGPYGATIVVIHHSNKGGHESAAMASRGSTALPAAVSQILHLTRLEQQGQSSMGGRRMLATEGRGGAPEKMLLELSEEGRWLFRGDGDALLQEQERQRTLTALNERQSAALDALEAFHEEEGEGLSAEHLASLLELPGKDAARAARRLLDQLKERGLVRKVVQSEGKGKGLVARYIPSLAPSSDSSDKIRLGADGKDGADGPADKRRGVSAPDPASLPASSSGEAKEAESLKEGDVFTTHPLQRGSTNAERPPRPLASPFESAEVLQDGQWRNGWVVQRTVGTILGHYFTLFRADDPTKTLTMHEDLVRPCMS